MSSIINQTNVFITFILGLSGFILWIVKWSLNTSYEREKLLIETGHKREIMYNDNFKERVRPLEEKLEKIHKSSDFLRKEHDFIIEELKKRSNNI